MEIRIVLRADFNYFCAVFSWNANLVNCSQVVQNALELIFLDSVSNKDELFQKEKNVSSDGDDVNIRRTQSVYARHNKSESSRRGITRHT